MYRLGRVLIGVLFAGLLFDAEQPPVDAPKLPPDVVAAWTRAGAEVGWMESTWGRMGFDLEYHAGALPALSLGRLSDDEIAKLPSVEQPVAVGLLYHSDPRLKWA